jgi:hypothetical protein
MVMVTQHGVNPMAGAQSAHQFCARSSVGAFLGNVITSECHDVRLQTIGRLNGAFDLFRLVKGL